MANYRDKDYDHSAWSPPAYQSDQSKRVEIKELITNKIVGRATRQEQVDFLHHIGDLTQAGDLDGALRQTHALAAHYHQGTPLPERIWVRADIKKKRPRQAGSSLMQTLETFGLAWMMQSWFD